MHHYLVFNTSAIDICLDRRLTKDSCQHDYLQSHEHGSKCIDRCLFIYIFELVKINSIKRSEFKNIILT